MFQLGLGRFRAETHLLLKKLLEGGGKKVGGGWGGGRGTLDCESRRRLLQRVLGHTRMQTRFSERASKRMDGWMDGWVDGWVDGWMEGRTEGGKKGKRARDRKTRERVFSNRPEWIPTRILTKPMLYTPKSVSSHATKQLYAHVPRHVMRIHI
eukprot:3436948-Rhodomonas_salina.3